MSERRYEVLVALGEVGEDRVLRGAQLFPIGKWSHPHGRIEVTPERASHFVEQFNRGVAGQQVPVFYIHHTPANVSNPDYGKAAGWIQAMSADPERGVLIDIEFSEEGAEAVRGRKYKYLSAEFFDKVQLPHHDMPESDVIVGAALVNRPHLKGMSPLLNEETGHQFIFEAGDNKAGEGSQGGGPMDPILVALCEAAGVDVADDQTELTEDQQDAVLAHQKELSDTITAKDAEIKDLKADLAKRDPEGSKVRSLAEAGFEDEAKEIVLARGERFIRELSAQVPDGGKLSPAVEGELRSFAENSDPAHLRNIITLSVEGKAIVDLDEKGTESAGNDDDESGEAAGNALVDLAEKLADEKDIPFEKALDMAADQKPELWNDYQKAMGSDKAAVEV